MDKKTLSQLVEVYRGDITKDDYYKLKYPYIMEQLQKLRVDIDGLSSLSTAMTQNLANSIGLRNSLKLAHGWCTKTIRVLNPEDDQLGEMKLSDIDVDTQSPDYSIIQFMYDDFTTTWQDKNIIERIDWLLSVLNGMISGLPDYSSWMEKFIQQHINSKVDTMSKDEFYAFEEEAYKKIPNWDHEIFSVCCYLTEAKMFLGFELLEIKKNLK
jgi:uncharacterized short protein YbdD (DUF466 family)